MTDTTTYGTIASSAVLVETSISTWTAHKLDKKVTDEVNNTKKASRKASRTNKNLLPEVKELADVIAYAAKIRNWVQANTLPWSDYGPRLLPVAQLFGFKTEMDQHVRAFNDLVESFVAIYPTLISAQAFKLGEMFDRDEYPSPDTVRSKFRIRVTYMPIAQSDDFRVRVTEDAIDDLRQDYEREYAERVDDMMADIRKRLKDALSHLADRFEDSDTGKHKRFHGTILDAFAERLATIRQFNITKDQWVETMASQAEAAISGIDVADLRKDEHLRADVREKVNNILDKFAI